MAMLVYHVTGGDFVFIFVCFFSAGLFRLALPAYGFVSTKQLEEIRLPAKLWGTNDMMILNEHATKFSVFEVGFNGETCETFTSSMKF